MTVLEKLSQIGCIPVIKLDNPEQDAAPLAKALCEGKLPAAEVTFRAAGAAKAMKLMKDACPEMVVGAGTVLTTAQVDEALEAGAEFIVSPGLNPKVVKYCQEKGVAILPGCVTPTEIEAALELGLTTLKFFPAAQYGGTKTIDALCAPYTMIKFMPTGGVTLANLKDTLSNKNIVACGGTFMVAANLINGGKWDEIKDMSLQAAAIVAECR
ncbi:MAG: bifunctional 4-hydroxy-2-oxoglutarate aldolase/2-dehydro-3-deoxy-phosphogluconate aldolase [Clostridia bacterium]